MQTYPLRETGNAVADSAGVATVRIGPTQAFESWHVESVAVQSTSALESELKEYLGDPSPSRLTGTSRIGNLDAGVNPNPLVLTPGENLVYQWTGCTPGSTCIVTLQGKRVQQR